jgi:hypothetical protein
MPTDARADLTVTDVRARAYAAAEYRVEGVARPFVLRVGEPSELLAALHAEHRVAASAFLTACNPGSRPWSGQANAIAHAALAADLLARGYRAVTARGVDPRGSWPDEPGFLVFGITPADATTVGRHFRQHGILYAADDAVPRLVLLD